MWIVAGASFVHFFVWYHSFQEAKTKAKTEAKTKAKTMSTKAAFKLINERRNKGIGLEDA